MPIKIDHISLTSPVLLAPMAGITDLPFRRLAARYGAGLVVSEMVASEEMVTERPSVRARAEVMGDATGSAVQIAGREAHWMAEAARICVDRGARIIDINMGCPAKKVTGGLSGSALMRDPDNALRLIDAVVRAVDTPVTLKMRLGWDDDEITAPEIARRAEQAGIRMITIHGRTRRQFYKGAADWSAIRPVVESVDIPVIANGDIIDLSTARRALALSGAAGVMIGRGAQGAPWTPALIAEQLAGRTAHAPAVSERAALIEEHYEAILAFYGAELGVRVARKHLGWHLAPLTGGRALRDRLVRIDDPAEASRALAVGLRSIVDAGQSEEALAA